MTALFIGRFQPFHNGHLDAINQILAECEFIKVGIGSSEESGTTKNPFSFEERKDMILNATKDLRNITIYPIPDINDDSRWVSHVKNLVGDFDIVYSGNTHVLSLFSKRGIKTKTQIFNLKISGTETRNKLEKGEDVSMYIP